MKNPTYRVLPGAGGRVRLAPFYDIASLLPYIRRRRDERFAMSIDSHYREDAIQPRHFERLARRSGYPSDELLRQIREWTQTLPGCAHSILREFEDMQIDTRVLTRLVEELETRCGRLSRVFGVE